MVNRLVKSDPARTLHGSINWDGINVFHDKKARKLKTKHEFFEM
jgi:hypothetical protein